MAQTPPDCQGQGLGAPSCGDGIYVVQWASVAGDTCELGSYSFTTTVVEDTARRVSGFLNRRYYLVEETINVAPNLTLGFSSNRANADGTFACDITNVAVYSPDVDPDNPGRWRPGFLSKLNGLNVFRFMDLFGTNNLNLATFEHFPSPAAFPLGYQERSLTAAIVSIGPPTPDVFSEFVGGASVRVTTATPHNLVTGMTVGLRTAGNTSIGLIQSTPVNPAVKVGQPPIDPTDLPTNIRQNPCRVIDATTFQVGIENYQQPPSRMTNTLTPANAYVAADIALGAAMAPADAAQLCVDAGLEPWINIPWLADDDCVTRLARAFAAVLPTGRLVHVEYGNEAWNYAFKGFNYAIRMDLLAGGTGDPARFYVTQMAHVHQVFRAAWAAAGRNDSEVRRVCGVQQGNTATTSNHLSLALAAGTEFDELAPASYWSNAPVQGPTDDLLTREQLLDLAALNVLHCDWTDQVAAHGATVAQFAAANPSQPWLGAIKLVSYEGGPDTLTTGTMTANLANRNHGVHRDPDFCEIMLRFFQNLQDAGVTLCNLFTLYNIGVLDQWGVYEGYAMPAGTGVVALDGANRTDFENLRAIKSETAAAVHTWLGLVKPPVTSIRTPRNGPTWSSARSYGSTRY